MPWTVGDDGRVVVFVADPGVDDALALGVLVAHDLAPSLVVATAGNVDVDVAAAVASRLVVALGLRCPVQAGRQLSLTRRPHPPGQDHAVHGDDGFGGRLDDLPLASEPDDFDPTALHGVDVFASGPLTAVAAALDAGAEPERVLWMGGGICGGNITAAAEYNAWCDPAAADRVLTSGVPIQVVPLEVTTQVRLDHDDMARWSTASASGALLSGACTTMLERGEAVPHDAVAAVAWFAPELFDWEPRHVRCESTGEHTRGALVVDRRPRAEDGPIRVAVDVDDVAVRRAIVDAIASLP